MCGFLGWFSTSPDATAPADASRFATVLDRIRHRVPDDAGVESGPGSWMGFRRLSILDLSLLLGEKSRVDQMDLLPPWIYDDRKKKTFTLPLLRWLRETMWKDRVQSVLRSQACRERGWFVPHETESHHRALSSLAESGKRIFVYSQRVWPLFVLESRAQRHLDAPPPEKP